MLLVVMAVPILVLAASAEHDRTGSSTTETALEPLAARPATSQNQANAAANYNLDWVSINGGGKTRALGTTVKSGVSIAQSVTGEATSASYRMGLGYWFGAVVACPVELTGDVNVDAVVTSADIIYLVNYVFKGGSMPQPCEAGGDVNCDASVTSADIIYLVGFVFKGGPAPCDVCTLIPGTWSC